MFKRQQLTNASSTHPARLRAQAAAREAELAAGAEEEEEEEEVRHAAAAACPLLDVSVSDL